MKARSGIHKVSHWLTRTDVLFTICFAGLFLVYGVGMAIGVWEVDAAAYALTAMEMYGSGNFLEIILQGEDWLDKPHMHFWPAALSYHVFGVNQFGFKLPAVLFTVLGLYYTYLFGKRYYSRLTGLLAALFLATAEHLIMANQDVRVEPYLTGLTIFALYYFVRYLEDGGHWKHLVLGCFGLGMLLMTKGPFTIIPCASAVLFTLIYQGKWRSIVHWQWLLVGVLTLFFTAPSLIAYYVQFDLHPEKVVWGETNVSGVEFFLWTSQWGRFTNTGPIKGRGDLFFYLHTMFWAYAPWVFLAYFALFDKTRQLIQRKVTGETYSYFGFLFLFIIFSFSKFQLPHYLVPLFPLLSILTADILLKYRKNGLFLTVFNGLYLVVILLAVLAVIALHHFYFERMPYVDTWLVLLVGTVLVLNLYLRSGTRLKKIVFAPAIVLISLNYYFNREFYADTNRYQSESEVAFYLIDQQYPLDRFITIDKFQRITDFELKHLVPNIEMEDFDPAQYEGYYAYLEEPVLQELQERGIVLEIIKTFEDFHITKLKGKFVNQATRQEAVTKEYLIKIR